MTYTLAMAADQGIQIADDGVAEVSMTDARALLTRLIRDVRWGGKVSAFTERGVRTAYVIPPAQYEQAEHDHRMVSAFHEAMGELPPEERPAEFLELVFAKMGRRPDS